MVASGTIMSSNEQKRFDRFILLGLPKFSSAIDKYGYKFLIEC